MTAVADRPTVAPEVGGDFRHRAACRVGVDPELFFPAASRGPEHDAQVAAAKSVCSGCPVLHPCREWALTGLTEGIAGGMTETERRAERARRRRSGRRDMAERSRGGNRAPLLISQNGTQAGTPAEGHRG